jgi:hypothetical protein
MPGSAHSSWIGWTSFPPGTFVARLYLNNGKTARPVVPASSIASTVYQANPAEKTKTEPATCAQPCEP